VKNPNRTFGYDLTGTLESVRLVVAGLADGSIPPPVLPKGRRQEYRFAPSFIRRRADDPLAVGVPYTLSFLGKHLGMTENVGRGYVTASDPVTAALLLLESRELGNLDEATLQEIAGGKFSLREIRQMFAPKVLDEERGTAAAASVMSNPFHN